MKHGRLFAKIIYYAFTFLFGIVLALGIPSYFATFDIPFEYVEDAIVDGRYDQAMVIVAAFINNNSLVEKQEFAESGAVLLYEGIIIVGGPVSSDEEDSSEQLREKMLYKSYIGFVYAPQYETYSRDNNATKLLITQLDGTAKTVELLNYDDNGDGKLDGIATIARNNFIILDINQRDVDSVKAIDVIDSSGTAHRIASDLELDFQSEFFDCFEKLPEYNQTIEGYYEPNPNTSVLDGRIGDLLKEFRSNVERYPDYQINSVDSEAYIAVHSEIQKIADRRAIPIIIIYFVVIYIVGDFLLGNFYIIKFFKWFLFKVCRIPHKEKKPPKKEEVFGHDYYSMVTLSLDTTEVPDFNGSVEIKYTNSAAEVKFTLLKAENYTSTQRIKAGVYVNPFIDINRDYAPVDLPDNLEVEGYRMDKTIKIVRRKAEQESAQATDEQSEQNTENN